jgi:predicted AlkP superfamily phosphohydrolase/phosphomutase
MASLMERGAIGRLETTAETLHVSAWPSIYTGTHPGEHGVYYTFQPAPGVQGYEKFHGDQYGRPTFWNLLSRNGVRCAVFDAPYTHTEEGSLATQVFEWGTWARHWRPMSEPSGLFRRLQRANGRYPLGLEALDIGLAHLDADDMRNRLSASARAKADATRWLMSETEWDLFFVVFSETHAGAHYCWAPPGDEGQGDTGDQPGLRQIYEEIDWGMGEILEAAGDDTIVLLASGDGVGPNRAGWHLLPEVLRRLGHLACPASDGLEGKGPADHPPPKDPIRRLRDALPKDFRKSVARKLPGAIRHRLARRVDMAGIDWSRTRAYCLPTDLEGHIRINLEGREPQGTVSPGDDYRALCAELAREMRELVDPVTGRRAVRDVILVDDVFPGPRRDWLPDLVVVWEPVRRFDRILSPSIGEVTGTSPDARPGTHAAPGFILVAGNRAGADLGPLPEHVCDIAPRLLSSYGTPIPSYMNRKSALGDPVARQGGRS